MVPAKDFQSLLRTIREAALPIASIDQEPVRELIMTADLIWGYDPKQDAMPLFYGKELLSDIAKGREDEFGYQALLCFTIDLTTNEPETLRAAVQARKGSCCYQRVTPDQDS